MRTRWLGSILGLLLGLTLALGVSNPARAQGFSVTITVDENGNGRLTNTAGFNGALTPAIGPDPGPGGLPAVLNYDLGTGGGVPGLVAGDLILLEPPNGVLSDVIRFIAPTANTGFLYFYSDNTDGAEDLADVGFPSAFQTNTLTVTEVGPEEGPNGFTYTPTAGQPGFVAGAAGPVTYVIISDVAAPEPGSIALLMLAGLPFAAGVRRLRKSRK